MLGWLLPFVEEVEVVVDINMCGGGEGEVRDGRVEVRERRVEGGREEACAVELEGRNLVASNAGKGLKSSDRGESGNRIRRTLQSGRGGP